jgi:multidrug efflux pump subunit AcrA (membrane-fusion protein)
METTPVRQTSPVLSNLLRSLNDPGDAGNGQSAAPPRRGRRLGVALTILVAAAVLVGAVVWSTRSVFGEPYQDLHLKYEPVERGTITFTVTEKGELEAAKNTDLACKVRNKSGGSFASTIKWLIEDGSHVKKGAVVARLEDSILREYLQTQTIAVTEKQALVIEAQREKEIVDSQNQIAIETAQNGLKIAEIHLLKYIEGELKQKQKDIHGRVSLAQGELKQWHDRIAWSRRMVTQGFISNLQVEAEESKLKSAGINLDKLLEEERVLTDYESKAMILDLESKVKQAKVALRVAEAEAASKTAKAIANLRAKSTILEHEETRLRELNEDVRACTVIAPHDGMVVYFTSESTRRNIIAVGEPVKENQKMVRIPDLQKMQVRVKVHESVQPRLRGDKTKKTSAPKAFQAALWLPFVGLDRLGALATAEDIRRLAVSEGMIKEEVISKAGQSVIIKVASLEKPLTGQVKWIAAVASQLDAMSSDVRVHPTLITVHDSTEELRPGMSAEVTIFVDERENVLRIPIHAVLEVAGEKFCYVKVGQQIEKRVLDTGLNNNRFVEVRKGLNDGDLVVQNPRPLAERRGDLSAQRETPRKAEKAPQPKDASSGPGEASSSEERPASEDGGEKPKRKRKSKTSQPND